MKEKLYEKVKRYSDLFEAENIQFLRHLFEYFDLYKQELNVKDNDVKAKDLIIFTAIKDYENKVDFQV